MNRVLLTLIFALTLAAGAFAVPVPSDPQHARSLDGTWRFKIEQRKSPTTSPAFWGVRYPVETPPLTEPFTRRITRKRASGPTSPCRPTGRCTATAWRPTASPTT